MKRKFLMALLTVIVGVCCCFGIAACDNDDSTDSWADGIFTVETAYAEAQELGYSGTLEEFIASISGTNGTNGVGISSVTLNEDGELVVTLSDSSSLNLGVIKGADGEDGEDGKDGATWYNGTYEAMNDVTANEGDYYLTTDTYAVYTYTTDGWSLVITSIKGEDGATGAAGATGETGAQGEQGEKGETGAQGEQGEAGEDGTDGATWYTGEGTPSDETGTDGDLYLDTATYDIYKMTDGAWTKIGNIKGATGETGAQGEKGETGAQGEQGEAGTDGKDLTAETITITFDANGGILENDEEEVESYSITVTKGNSVDLPVPTRDGYAFTGWYYGTGANAGQVTDVTPISRDMTLTAAWERVYEMSIYLGSTNVRVGNDGWFYGYYEGTYTSTGRYVLDITIGINGEEYSIEEAVSSGYVSNYYIYNYDGYNGYVINGNYYQVNYEGYICYNYGGEYTVTVSYGNSSASYEVSVTYFDLYLEGTEIYTDSYSYFENWYYGDSEYDYPVIEITSTDGYSHTYNITDTYGFSANDSTEDTEATTYVNIHWYGGIWMHGEIYFYEAGTYTVTIYFGEDSTSYTVVVTDYVFEGEVCLNYTYYNGNGTRYYSSEISITDYNTDYYYTLWLYFDAPSDASISVTLDGNAVGYGSSWSQGTYQINFDLKSLANNAIGTYEIIVTVSSEEYGEGAVTVTYTIVQVPDFYYYSTPSSSVLVGDGIYFNLYYYGEEEYDYPVITISDGSNKYTINCTEWNICGEIYDDDDSYVVLYYDLYYNGNNVWGYIWFYVAGDYTVTISFGDDSDSFDVTASCFDTLISDTRIYTYERIDFELRYFGFNTGTMAVAISDGADYFISGSVGSGGTIGNDDETTYIYAYYDGVEYAVISIEFYVAGTYTVTISFGEDSVSFYVYVTANGGSEETGDSGEVTGEDTEGDSGTTDTSNGILVDIGNVATGTYSETTTLYSGEDGTTVAVTADEASTVAVESHSKSYTVTDEDGNTVTEFSGTQRLKLGGAGAEDYSYRCIEVTTVDACTITVYMMSSSSTDTRQVNLTKATVGEDGTITYTVISTDTVDGSALNKVTYTISEAGTYYLATTSGGVNVYGIIITYAADADTDTDTDAAYVGNSYTVDFTTLTYYENDVESEELKEQYAEIYSQAMVMTITFTDSENATFVMDNSSIEGGSTYSLTGSYTLDNGTFAFTNCAWDDGSTTSDTSGAAFTFGDATEFVNGSIVSLGYDGTDVTFWLNIGGSSSEDEDGNVTNEEIYTAAGAMVLATE